MRSFFIRFRVVSLAALLLVSSLLLPLSGFFNTNAGATAPTTGCTAIGFDIQSTLDSIYGTGWRAGSAVAIDGTVQGYSGQIFIFVSTAAGVDPVLTDAGTGLSNISGAGLTRAQYGGYVYGTNDTARNSSYSAQTDCIAWQYHPSTTTALYPNAAYVITGDRIAIGASGFRSSLNQKKIDADNENCSIDGVTYKLRYRIDSPTETLKEGFLSCNGDITQYDFPGLDDYTLDIAALATDGTTMLPSTTHYSYQSVLFHITVNGTDYQGGNSDQFDCSQDSGYFSCAQVSPYADCSTYGLDVVGGFQCIIGNFQVWLRTLFVSLFVPKASFMAGFQKQMGDLLTSQLGFLEYPATFLPNLFTALIGAPAYTVSSPCISFGHFSWSGSNNVEFCPQTLQQRIPALWNVLQIVLVAVTAFALIIALYRTLNMILGDK